MLCTVDSVQGTLQGTVQGIVREWCTMRVTYVTAAPTPHHTVHGRSHSHSSTVCSNTVEPTVVLCSVSILCSLLNRCYCHRLRPVTSLYCHCLYSLFADVVVLSSGGIEECMQLVPSLSVPLITLNLTISNTK